MQTMQVDSDYTTVSVANIQPETYKIVRDHGHISWLGTPEDVTTMLTWTYFTNFASTVVGANLDAKQKDKHAIGSEDNKKNNYLSP